MSVGMMLNLSLVAQQMARMLESLCDLDQKQEKIDYSAVVKYIIKYNNNKYSYKYSWLFWGMSLPCLVLCGLL